MYGYALRAAKARYPDAEDPLEMMFVQHDEMRDRESRHVHRLLDALNEVYPVLAGRTILLKEAGEERAAARWAEYARKVFDAILSVQ